MKIKPPFPARDKMKTIITCAFLAAILALSSLIGALNITFTANTSKRDYSVDNIVSHIATISQKEHSIYDTEANAEVRSYISSTLYGYGMENEIITHLPRYDHNEKTDEFSYIAPNNVYAEIAGTSGVNILLIAHYDSCPYKIKYGEASEGSHGAIDDGYGTAVLLELARIYSQVVGLKNGIKFAFVDGEENGLLGSYALVEEYADWLTDVNLVINVESRGETGPVYLFQTSDNDDKIIELYGHAGFPYTFSVASDIYGIMPNDTDLSPFLENGYPGLNVATLDNLKNYHNAGDKFENIDEVSLAKYCDTLLPLLDEYTQNDKYSDIDYFKGTHDTLFFTLFPNAMVSYSAAAGWAFFAIALAAVAALVGVFIYKKKINIKRALVSLALDIALLAVICGLGFLICVISCAVCGVNFHFMFVIGVGADVGILITLCVLSAAAVAVVTLIKRKFGITYREMSVGAILFNALLSIVCACVLFGGSFIFVITTLLYTCGSALTVINKDKLRSALVGAAVGVASLFTISFYISLVYSVYLSLSFGALGLLLLITALPFTLCLPHVFGFYGEREDGNLEKAEADVAESGVAV